MDIEKDKLHVLLDRCSIVEPKVLERVSQNRRGYLENKRLEMLMIKVLEATVITGQGQEFNCESQSWEK